MVLQRRDIYLQGRAVEFGLAAIGGQVVVVQHQRKGWIRASDPVAIRQVIEKAEEKELRLHGLFAGEPERRVGFWIDRAGSPASVFLNQREPRTFAEVEACGRSLTYLLAVARNRRRS
jgi:hypothetical protein